MKNLLIFTCFLLFQPALCAQSSSYALVIHGGAGNITESGLNSEKQQMYHDSLARALQIGSNILQNGGTSLDAVEATIRYLEDCPLFNAGKGAVFTADGKNELDAAIMDGRTHLAGAVAGVTTVRHPISAARAVMEKSPHVLLIGKGAEQFASEQSLEIVDSSYFRTPEQWLNYRKARARADSLQQSSEKHGTVGCVALDTHGNLAAGTSTGGMMMKRYGRVGDSPIIGAGTYADNESCAVSATGHGEYFIRNVVAYDIAALMKYKGLSLQEAASSVILEKLKDQDASGGVIAVDHEGNFSMVFNTAGMFRAWMKEKDGIYESGIRMFR